MTNYSTAVMLFNEDIRAIKVSYELDKEGNPIQCYTYKTLDKNIEVGDYVVVPTSTRHGMTVNRVEEVDVEVDFESSTELKWIVSKVSKDAYDSIIEDEKIWIDQMKRAEMMKKRRDIRQSMVDMYDEDGVDMNPLANLSSGTKQISNGDAPVKDDEIIEGEKG